MYRISYSRIRALQLLSALIFIFCISEISYASNNDLIGKWYDQTDPNAALELFEDHDASATGKTPATGKWSQLSDGRIKVKIDTAFGSAILLGTIKGDLLTLSFNNKTTFYRKTAPQILTREEIIAKARKKNKPNPTNAQKTDPNYVWNSPDKEGLKGLTALHWAAINGDIESAKQLLKKGANINAKATRTQPDGVLYLTPLDLAFGVSKFSTPYKETDKNKAIISLLESHGALMGTVKVLMKLPKKTVKSKGYLKQELFGAFIKNDINLVKRLIKQGADAEAAGICDSKNRIREPSSAERGRVLWVYFAMISAGADVNCKDEYGFGPLDDILDFEIARQLLAMGSDPNQKTRSGSPLHTAIVWGDNKLARLYISYGADVNAIGGDGISKDGSDELFRGTPLSVIESYGQSTENDNIIKLLEMHGGIRKTVLWPTN